MSTQWNEPVTGSSLMRIAGAKKRETKSCCRFSGLAFAVTPMPREEKGLSAWKSGVRLRTSDSFSSSMIISQGLRKAARMSEDLMLRCASSSGGS